MASKIPHIDTKDVLNTGRNKINSAIDYSYQALDTSEKALKEANKLGNEAKDIATKKGNESIKIANEKGDKAISIANEKGNKSLEIANSAEDKAQKTSDEVKEMIKEQDLNPNKDLEVVQARGSYETLSERLDTLASESEIEVSDSFLGRIDGVRDVFLNNIENEKKKLNENVFNMAIIFDPHYMEGSTVGDNILRKSISHISNIMFFSDKLDCVISGGDNSDVNPFSEDKKNLINTQKQYADFFYSLNEAEFCAILKGNHDDGSLSANYHAKQKSIDSNVNIFLSEKYVVTDKEFSELYRQDENQNEKRLNKSNYFYRDFPEKKVRVIGLDTSDTPETKDKNGFFEYPRQFYSVISQDQIDWLVTEALSLEEDYKVVVITHWALDKTVSEYKESDNPYSKIYGNACVNHDVVIRVLEAYQNKEKGVYKSEVESPLKANVEFDFSDKNGNIACVFSGHLHHDLYKKIRGINYVSTCCSMGLSTQYNRGQATLNTYNEECFDLITLDSDKIKLKRIGAGNDREINY